VKVLEGVKNFLQEASDNTCPKEVSSKIKKVLPPRRGASIDKKRENCYNKSV
jgi:hypothetical protein